MKKALCAAVLVAGVVGAVSADTVFDTGTPQGGFLGYYGYDIYVEQSVAVAFTPDQDYMLEDVGVWMMNNNFSKPGAEYTLSLRADANGGQTLPGSVIESWTVYTEAVGWNPILETVESLINPVLEAGTTYWIMAEGDEPAFVDPVWVASSQSEPVWNAIWNTANPGDGWSAGYGQGVPGLVVNGTAVPTPGAFAVLALAGIGACGRRRG